MRAFPETPWLYAFHNAGFTNTRILKPKGGKQVFFTENQLAGRDREAIETVLDNQNLRVGQEQSLLPAQISPNCYMPPSVGQNAHKQKEKAGRLFLGSVSL